MHGHTRSHALVLSSIWRPSDLTLTVLLPPRLSIFLFLFLSIVA